MNSKKIAILILAIIIVAGVGGGIFWYKNKKGQDNTGKDNFKIETFYGEIAELKTNTFSIKFQEDILADSSKYKTIDFIVNQDTQFKKYGTELKSTEEFAKEHEEYNKKIVELEAKGQEVVAVEAPSWNVQKSITFQELKVGDIAEVYSYRSGDSYVTQKVNIKLGEAIDNSGSLQSTDLKNKEVVLSGTVKEKSAESIKIKAETAVDDEGKLQEIYISTSTEVILKKKKTDKEFQKELDAFNKALADNKSNNAILEVLAPDWYVIKKVTSEMIGLEDKVVITAFQKDDNKIEASKIEIFK